MRPAKQGVRRPSILGNAAEARMVTYSPAITHPPVRDDESSQEPHLLSSSDSGVELIYPARLVSPAPWIGHIPFAFWLVEALRPQVMVELGVHSGNSYCAFLQGIQHLSLTAQCYGIDHWRGDDHALRYGEEVFEELSAYHDPLYGTFSTLVRAMFDDALLYFSDQSVDLLHIDGFHTYDAVAHDFSSWLPKMSPRGVVLLHDINVRERGFGVWQFWEDLTARYDSLSFVHSHGLGLVYVGTEPAPAPLRALLSLDDPDELSRVRAYFGRLGMSLVDRFARRQAEEVAARVKADDTALAAAQAEVRSHVETAVALRAEMASANAHAAALQRELESAKAETARHVEVAAVLQRDLLAASTELARQIEVGAALQQQRIEVRAEAARQSEAVAKLRQELVVSRTETARRNEAYATLQLEHSTTLAEAARQGEENAALQRELEASRAEAEHLEQKASKLVALLESELQAAKAEVSRHLETTNESRAKADRVTAQLSEALAQRERTTQMLRQQLMATTALQRELTALRQRERESVNR